ncbi:MAG TPA: hypothetical protein VFO89_13840, partial [Thermoanaerobaculia bacterium]|nr:hypothetical protein [Thermoanaerobaculia bacterium]
MTADVQSTAVRIPIAGQAWLNADLTMPRDAAGLVVFAHGSGSSRLSPRNRRVARRLNATGLGTLLADLLTEVEEIIDEKTRGLRFDIPLLTRRLVQVIDWARVRDPRIGLFGASTGAAAALDAAAMRRDVVRAVVSRGGRPDLASRLKDVLAPTLLIVGGNDRDVLDLNRRAARVLRCPKQIEVIAGATHLFEEPGAL